MSIALIAEWALRAFGALYLVGGVFGLRQFFLNRDLDRMTERLERMAEEAARDLQEPARPRPAPEDRGRDIWLLIGTLLLFPAGVAMLLAHRLSVLFLCIIIIHQMFYFTRQRLRELAAKSPGAKEEARPARATINGFFTALVVTVMAAWLYRIGALA